MFRMPIGANGAFGFGTSKSRRGVGRHTVKGQRCKVGMTPATIAATLHSMSLPSDQPPTSPPEKPKMSAEERRLRHEDRLKTVRLRMLIFQELDQRDITTLPAIGDALGMPPAEATSLLTRHQWHEGDVARLQAAAARLGVQMSGASVKAE